MTAACGVGYQGQCCCECALHLVAKPRFHHLGGKGACGPYAPHDSTALDQMVAEIERAKLLEAQGVSYACQAFASEGMLR